LFTVCPKCTLTLVVTTVDLRAGQGYVRCGRCANVFNALIALREGEPGGATGDTAKRRLLETAPPPSIEPALGSGVAMDPQPPPEPEPGPEPEPAPEPEAVIEPDSPVRDEEESLEFDAVRAQLFPSRRFLTRLGEAAGARELRHGRDAATVRVEVWRVEFSDQPLRATGHRLRSLTVPIDRQPQAN
jgi:predicted Zn finger-like uncharacterized protein